MWEEKDVYQLAGFVVRPDHPTDHDPTISLAKNPGEYCKHFSVIANAHQRTITCAKCKAVVDAFDFVNGVAKQIDRAAMELKCIRIEAQRASQELEDLKKEAKNLKLRIKRAKS